MEKAHNDDLHSLYRSPNIVRVIESRRLRWAGPVVKMEEGRKAFKILTGKPTGKKPLRGPSRRCEDNIRMDENVKEIGVNTRNFIDLTHDRGFWRVLINVTLNLRVS